MVEIQTEHENDIYWRGWNEAVAACAALLRTSSIDIGYPEAAASLEVHDRMQADRMTERLTHRRS